MDVASWLRGLGLGQYEATFRDNAVDGEVLSDLTDADLEKLGVLLGHRKKLLRAIAALQAPIAGQGEPTIPPGRIPDARPDARPAAERRQLTVMFVDLVGSTALSGRLDPEDMREVIAAYQNTVAGEVARFEGHVAKYMGDGVLAYFGWPRAHEDEAERAVRAGLAAADAVSRLVVPNGPNLAARVGIATGVVVVGDLIGEGGAREEAVVGETPNLAARLQALAEPGQVVVADGTRQLIGGLFDCVDLGSVRPKGFAQPVRAWRVGGLGAAEGRFEALHAAELTPLIGREQEIALLLEHWQQAKEGEGQVVLLSGEPGIGKSRFVQALRERLSGEAYTALSHFCSPRHQTSALHPVVGLLERAAGLARGDSSERRLDKLETMIALATEDVRQVAPLFASLLSIPTDERYPPPTLEPQRQKERTFEALLGQLAGLATRHPLLVLWEDVQWADPSSLELLDLLVGRVSDLAVLLVVTCRPEFVPPRTWTRHPHFMPLSLNRLSRRQGTAMVERLTGNKALPEQVLEGILLRTDGVPLFVEELTKAVLEAGLLEDLGDRYALTGPLPPLAIPASLHDSLLARLDHLAPVKRVAQVAAVVGREFSEELLAAVAPLDGDELRPALNRLVDAGLVIRRGAPSRTTYAFKHALVQEAAYGTLLRGHRQQLHGRVVEALERRFPEILEAEPALLAHHCAEAGLADKAVGYWRAAGVQALARSALAEAVTQLTRGLELLATLPDGPDRQARELELQVMLGGALIAARGFAAPETGRAYARARRLCGELGTTSMIFPALFGQVMVCHLRAEHETGREASEEMLRLAERQGDLPGLLSGHRCLGTSLHHLGELVAARHHLERALALYDPPVHRLLASSHGWDPRVAALSWLSWTLFVLGFPDRARERGRQAVAEARELGHLNTLATALVHAAILCQLDRDHRGAGERAGEVIALCEERGVPLWLAAGRIVHGWALAMNGEPQRGVATVGQGLEAWRATGAEGWMPYYLGLAAEAYGRADRIEEALAAIEDGLARAEGTGARWFEAELWRLRAGLLPPRGTPQGEEAWTSLERALTVARGQEARMWELRAARDLARLWADSGERRKARDLLAPILGWFGEGLDTSDLIEAKALLVALR